MSNNENTTVAVDGSTGDALITGTFNDFPTHQITFEILFSAEPHPTNDFAIASYAVPGTSNEFLLFAPNDGVLYVYINGARYNTGVLTNDIIDSTFHRISITWDSSTNELNTYIDGDLESTIITRDLGPISPNGVLVLGQEQDTVGGGFVGHQVLNGDIADVRVFDHVRTPQEIADHNNQEILDPENEDGLVSYYNFGSEDLGKDLAGNNDLEPIDSPVFVTSENVGNTDGDDIIVGTENDDVIDGNSGNDTIDGRGGDDQINGGSGADIITGGDGNDTIAYGEGGDTVYGGDGNDTIDDARGTQLGDHDDYVDGGDGDDRVWTGGGDDTILGGEGNDQISGDAGNDDITGGEGADDIDGGTGEEDIVRFDYSSTGVTVDLDSGTGSGGDAEGDTYDNAEFIHGSAHDDVLTGDEKTNRLVGRNGDDQLYGGDGNDTLVGGRGADHLDGGAGDRDVAEYDWSSAGVIVNLETGVGSGGFAEGDTLTGIEYIYGSYYDDILTGDSNVNRLVGDRGDDILNGGGGNDILVGGEGADQLNGGSGARDAADYGEASQGVVVDLVNGGSAGDADGDTYTGVEFVYGSGFDDVITGDAADNRLVGAGGDDQLYGGEGKDYLLGGEGADLLHGGAGTGDTAVYRDATSGVGVDLANGGFAGEATGDTFVDIEYVDGSDFDDVIIGDDGQNRLVGQGGADIINGGAGNDYIIGMQDNDTLTGGAGDDVFLYKDLFGDDIITDFEAGAGRTDRIWLDFDGIEDMSDLTITDTANGALIEVDGYGTILLENVNAADLASDDFIF